MTLTARRGRQKPRTSDLNHQHKNMRENERIAPPLVQLEACTVTVVVSVADLLVTDQFLSELSDHWARRGFSFLAHCHPKQAGDKSYSINAMLSLRTGATFPMKLLQLSLSIHHFWQLTAWAGTSWEAPAQEGGSRSVLYWEAISAGILSDWLRLIKTHCCAN